MNIKFKLVSKRSGDGFLDGARVEASGDRLLLVPLLERALELARDSGYAATVSETLDTKGGKE